MALTSYHISDTLLVPQTIACLRIAKSPLELPFDFLGIVYFPLDDFGGSLVLARKLKAVGFPTYRNDLI